MRVKLETHPKLTERVIQMAIASDVQWWNVTIVPNWARFHEMDVAVLTRAGYLWEYEIKVDQRDWDTDNRKDMLRRPNLPASQWNRPTRNLEYVKRFHYVYARGLRCPDWVPEWAGLIEADYHTSHGECYVNLQQHRRPQDRRVEKLPADAVRRMFQSTYHRFWRQAFNQFHGGGSA